MAPRRSTPRSGQRRADFRWAAKVRSSVAWCVAGAVAGVSLSLGNVAYIEVTQPSLPSVVLKTPRNGTQVSDSKGFAVTGTVSSLGTDTLWILDYDGGSTYTVDEPATVTLSGKWYAFSGPLSQSSGPKAILVTIDVVVANRSCDAKLSQSDNPGLGVILSLPSGCEVVAETTVSVSRH
jgi:hypothetical protein